METKWIAILSIGLAAAMFGPLAVVHYKEMECRIEGIKSNLTPEAVEKICHRG